MTDAEMLRMLASDCETWGLNIHATRLRALAETLGRVTGEMAEAVESCVTDAGLYLDNHLGGRSARDTAQLDRASAAAELLAALAGGTTEG